MTGAVPGAAAARSWPGCGQLEEALESCDTAIQLNDKDALAWTTRGMILADLGRYEETAAAFARVVDLSPDELQAFHYQCAALIELKRYDGALDLARHAIELKADNSVAWLLQGLALAGLGQHEEALRSLDKALELGEETSFLYSSVRSSCSAGPVRRRCTFSLSPAPAPTETLAPSLTPRPSPVPSITPTLWSAFTLPGPSQQAFEGLFICRRHSQSIRNHTHFDPREKFSVGWKVQNIGSAQWNPDDVTFVYYAGAPMQMSDQSRLQAPVAPSEYGLLLADMRAPRAIGKHTTTWALKHESDYFCTVSLTIVVP